MRLPLLVAALALAGCAAPGPGSEPAQDVPLSFQLRGCSIQEIIAGVPPESLAPFVPEGFEAEPFPAQGLSALIALTTVCPEPEPTSIGVVIIPVVRVPDGLARENASAQGIITSIVVDEGERTWDALQAWGYGPTLSRGAVAASDLAPAVRAALQAGEASVEREGGGRFDLGTNVRGIPRTDEGNFLRFFMVHEDRVIGVWDCDLTGNHQIFSGEAHMKASGYAPLPEEPVAGLGFHETSDVFAWTRVAFPPTPPDA
ncbi:MAG TPA: hypothetical protein VFH78_13350 [Candidatus Thermoplasmatota archaeon]|nr:hypothetical protein [Candidatus Thermoplasmatota archaeon]